MMGGIGSGRVTSFGQSVEGAILHEVDLAAQRLGPDGRIRSSTAGKAKPAKRGRKPTWRDGNLEQTAKLAALGLTDTEMADFFGVSTKTFARWKLSKPEFCRALKAGKEIADARVEQRLYERAVGYSVEIEK